MKGLLLAIFLGWAGGYRFYKKQKVLGFIYLFTLGLYFVGWIIDIIMASIEFYKGVISKSSASNGTRPQMAKLPGGGLVYDCEIRGAFAASLKMPSMKRYNIVKNVPVGSDLFLETAYYEGTPYFLVCVAGGLDIGALPKELSQLIKTQYPDAQLSAVLTDKTDLEHPLMKLTISRGQ